MKNENYFDLISVLANLVQLFLKMILRISQHFPWKKNSKARKQASVFLAVVDEPAWNRNLFITAAKYSLKLKKDSQQSSVMGRSKVMQTVTWHIEANCVKGTVSEYFLAVSHGAFTAWKSSVVEIYATLQMEGNEYVLQAETSQRLHRDICLVHFPFPEGVVCERGEGFLIIITLRWKKGSIFKSVEHFLAAPENYGRTVEQMIISVDTGDTGDTGVLWRDVSLYGMDKTTHRARPVFGNNHSGSNTVKWEIIPQKDIYIIQIES